MKIDALKALAKKRGLFITPTLGGSLVIHSSISGYAVFQHSIFRGSMQECVRFLNEKI